MKPSRETVLPELPNTAVWNSEEGAGPPIELLPLVRSFAARWPLLLLAVFAGGAIAYGLSFLKTPEYESSAVFLPPQQQAAMSENPFGALLGKSNTGTEYPGLLKSNSVVDQVLHALDLERAYNAKDIERARKILRSQTNISTDTAGFYTVAVDDKDPARAKAIADMYLQALTQINARLSLDQANQERMIYERQLRDAKDQLEKAEENLAKEQESSGVVSAQTQTQAGLVAINQLRTEITQREVELAVLAKQQTEESPAVVRLRAQIAALQAELQSMEKGSGGGAGAGLSAARAPEANLRYLRLQREVLYQQTLFEILTKQFESTQLQANAPGVQVVDYPEMPLRKASPRRLFWAIGGALLALLVTVAMIFVEDRYRVLQEDPERRQDLAALADAVKRPRWGMMR
jgi:uncharacterized protein involved in exopolysaccharide biosynthesis